MKSRKQLSDNNISVQSKLFDKNQNKTFNLLLLPNPHLKEEILFSNKFQKQLLLSQIKQAQLSILSKIGQNESFSKKNKANFFKQLLHELKNNLSDILNQKKLKENYLLKNINDTKNFLQKKIFNFSIQKQIEKKEIEGEICETAEAEKKFEGNELSKLKMLNFEIENEIKKINFIIKKKIALNNQLQMNKFFREENREIFLYQKENSNEIDKIFISEMKQLSLYLNKLNINKNMQNAKIELIENDINIIMQNIEIKNNNLYPTDIILENSLENNINSLSNFSNSYVNNNSNENYNYIFGENKSKINDIEQSENNDVYSEGVNDNVGNIFNLNMNINFNINVNKYISKMINKSFDNRKVSNYNNVKIKGKKYCNYYCERKFS